MLGWSERTGQLNMVAALTGLETDRRCWCDPQLFDLCLCRIPRQARCPPTRKRVSRRPLAKLVMTSCWGCGWVPVLLLAGLAMQNPGALHTSHRRQPAAQPCFNPLLSPAESGSEEESSSEEEELPPRPQPAAAPRRKKGEEEPDPEQMRKVTRAS